MQRKVLPAVAIMFMVGTVASAATLEVGAGKTYTSIQTAINASSGGTIAYGNRPNDTKGDTIIIYPGTYPGFTIPGGYDCMTIKAAYNPMDITTVAQRVLITGTIIDSLDAEGCLIEGLYVNSTHATSAVLQSYGRMNTWQNMIVYSGAGTNAAIYGYSQWGQETYNHTTVYDMGYPWSEGYMSQLNLWNSIIAFNDNPGVGTAYGGPTGGYNCFYKNGTGNIPFGSYTSGSTDINADPQFQSTNPDDLEFLRPGGISPCVGTASDGGNRGALPVPEPITMALLALAGAFGLRRRGN